jgi:hypothetical protein
MGGEGMSMRLITARVLLGTLGSLFLIGTAMASFALRRPDGSSTRAWTSHLERIDAALVAQDISLAERAWLQGYQQALGSRRWEGMVEAGDAALRIGANAKSRRLAAPRARQAYLTALVRARGQRSVDGVVRTAEAFARLGDREVVEQALRIARDLAGTDPEAEARVRAVVDQSTRVSAAAHGLGTPER